MERTTKKLLLITIVILVALNIVLITIQFTQCGHGGKHKAKHCERNGHCEKERHQHHSKSHHKKGREEMMRHFLKHKIGFDEAQMEKAKASKDRHFSFMKAQKEKIKKLSQVYFENDDQASTVLDSLKVLHSSILTNRYEHFNEILKMATPKQKEELKEAFLRMLMHEKPPGHHRRPHHSKPH